MYLTILHACLCVNWFFGFVASFRTRKDLANVHFRNLNGSVNFEALMVFCQLQILVLVGCFIFGFSRIRSTFVEVRTMQILATKNEGEAWH